MDPFFLALAIAIARGVSTVAGRLIDKGVIDTALEPAADKLKQLVQGGVKGIEKDNALVCAILMAIEQAVGQTGESLAMQYAQRLHLHELVEPGNEQIRDEAMRLVYVASSDDPALIPDSLLSALHLDVRQRPVLARFLFYLRRQLATLSDFRPMLNVAHQQRIESALQQMSFVVSTVANTVEKRREGDVLRVRMVDDWNPEPYLRYLAAECNRLRLSAIDPQYVTLNGESKITLLQVYTDLETTTMIWENKKEGVRLKVAVPDWAKSSFRVGGDRTGIDFEQLEKTIDDALLKGTPVSLPADAGYKLVRMTALEVISDPESPRIALLGAPGAGKSTFANYLTLCMAMAQLEPGNDWLQRLSGWSLGVLLPVRIVLRDFATWADIARKPVAQTLWDFIRHDLTENGFAHSFEPLKKWLQERGGLIVLDGLDEVPDADARRDFVKIVIENFACVCSLCRVVVTCRPYAYRDPQWKLDGFIEHTFAPFSEPQIHNFINRWYETIAPIQGWSLAFAQTKAAELIAATKQRYLSSLADRPLLLTLMATLHTSRGKLPDDRADLYADCVALMLDYWQRGKETIVRGHTQVEDGVLNVLGIPRDDLEHALSRVAFETHQQQGLQADRKLETANISGDDLRRILAPAFGNSLDRANTVIGYIQTRAGLLAEHGPDTYAFPHRTFQEFLAACYILDSEDFPMNLAEWVCADRDWWREVFLLAAGRARRHGFGQAVALINALCDKDYRAGEVISNLDAAAAVLAAQAAVEVRLPERAQTPRYRTTLLKLQTWLVGIISEELLSLVERAEVGRILSALGDPRPDVACLIPALVEVPAGDFHMGSNTFGAVAKPRHRISLPAYRIGKHPVTNMQYGRFIQDGGYSEKHRDCWTDAGWQWRRENVCERPQFWDDSHWNLDNHPIVGISWYEAIAYCNWLTKVDHKGGRFRLPTEAEWENAARGNSHCRYPWGDEFDAGKSNTSESGIDRTSAVGLFGRGKSPYRANDLAGNVAEWCSTVFQSYPYRADDGREDLQASKPRVLRGGSWGDDRDYVHNMCRIGNAPNNRSFYYGFRVAES